MIEYLVKDYWNKHNSFDGIERNEMILQCVDEPDFLRWCYKCLGISEEKLQTLINKQLNEKVFQKYAHLTAQQKEIVLLLLKYCLTSDSCRSKDGVLAGALFYIGVAEECSSDIQRIFREGLNTLKVVESEQNFIRGNVLYTNSVSSIKELRSLAIRLLRFLQKVVIECVEAPYELLGIMANIKKYHKLLAISAAMGLTFEQLIGLFDYSLPDQTWAMQNFGTMVYVIAPGVYLVYTNEGAHYVNEQGFYQLTMTIRKQSPLVVQSF